MRRRTKLLWLAPAALALIAVGTLLALPGFVAAQNHRPAMEHFASSLTGRQVSIAGRLSLTILPGPELTATQITIAGPDDELITARALKLDIAIPALFRGELAAQTLYLDSPHIAFPWPLPGGPKAIAPPAWLAALHAHLNNASISIGAVQFSHVNADLFTSPGGGVSIAGDGMLDGVGIGVTAALGPIALDGAAPLTVEATAGPASGNFNGSLSGQSGASGQLNLTLPGGVSGTASIAADGETVALADIALGQGHTSVSGTATLNLSSPILTANLIGQNLNFDLLKSEFAQDTPNVWPLTLPVNLTLDASNITIRGQVFPALAVTYGSGPAGIKISSLNLTLPGGGAFTGAGGLDGSGALSGQLSLAIPDTTALLAAYQLPALQNWPAAHLTATLNGTPALPRLRNLAGTLGQDHVSGSLILDQDQLAGQLAFDHLALAPLAAWLSQRPGSGLKADMEITAERADAGPVKFTNLALDGALDGTLNIRRISANLYGGLAAGSFTLDSAGRITDAQGFIDIPSAAPLLPMIPSGFAPPADVLAPRLSVLFVARGPAQALSVSAVARLGDFNITASPIINLTQRSATGALTLQHPEAILVARLFGIDHGLAWPGAGSASLRASFTASATTYGLNDFVLSFGATNASGRVLAQNSTVSGEIQADTLAVPLVPASLALPTSLDLQGTLKLSINQLLYAGKPLLGISAGSLNWTPGGVSLDIAKAMYGTGSFSGSLGMALNPRAAPAFTAKILAQGIDASSIALPISFPYPITTGILNATASLTASGYGLKSVVATLGGTATLTASNGVLRGFNLQGFGNAVGGPNAVDALYHALISGSTDFTTLNLAATFAQGNCSLDHASLDGPAGHVSGTGGIDLYDNAQALHLVFTPANVNPAVSANLLVLGTWAQPRHIAHMKQALDWTPPAVAATPNVITPATPASH